MDGFGLLLMDTRVGDSNWFKRTQSARYPQDISVIERDEWEIRVKCTQKCKFALILRGSWVVTKLLYDVQTSREAYLQSLEAREVAMDGYRVNKGNRNDGECSRGRRDVSRDGDGRGR
jgi:hypothetical protein